MIIFSVTFLDTDDREPMKTCHINVGFEVLVALVTNIAIFWNTAPCDLSMKRFRGTYHLHLQSRK
jgi:hypothetical protein